MRKRDKKSKSPTVVNSNCKENHAKQEADVSYLVLWKSPISTIYYAVLQTLYIVGNSLSNLFGLVTRKRLIFFIVILTTLLFLNKTPGSHQTLFFLLRKNIWWSLYWVGLGILSSFGFGFGLHTFLLYLAPHLIRVTLRAYDCQSVNFPEPPYPDKIECPEETGVITLWVILYKVIWECFMWGVGTAIGELPPYIAARGYRMSGEENEDEAELEALSRMSGSTEISFADRCKIFVRDLVNKAGFFGILICASVPNPLFDLAGIVCGLSLIPFWTFFGATLIGKAVIKMLIQTVFVIVIFSEEYLHFIIQLISNIPRVGSVMGPAIENFLEEQKNKLRSPDDEGGHLRLMVNIITYIIIVCFVVSLLNKLAQDFKRKERKSKTETR